MERRIITIQQDMNFARDIDLNCTICPQPEVQNAYQLRNLNDRLQEHPEEKQVILRFIDICTRCLIEGRPTLNTLQARYSCFYRNPQDIPDLYNS
jgi:hypothetical protein